MPKLKCLCGNEYTVTAKEAERQVACKSCGWSVEPHEISRYVERAGGDAEKHPETAPAVSPAPEQPEDGGDSKDRENGD